MSVSNFHISLRYWVFGGDEFYPRGGMNDALFTFANREEAIAYARGFVSDSLKWAHVYDSATRTIHKVG